MHRSVDSKGNALDFYLLSRRDTKAAYRFLSKLFNQMKKGRATKAINIDKVVSYGRAIMLPKKRGSAQLELNTVR